MNTFVGVIGFTTCTVYMGVVVRDLHKRAIERIENEFDEDEDSPAYENIVADFYGVGLMVFAISYEIVKGIVLKFKKVKTEKEWTGYGDETPKIKLGAFERDV